MAGSIGMKNWIAIITVIILLLTSIVTVVTSISTTNNDVLHNNQMINENRAGISSNVEHIQDNRNDITAMNAHYEHILKSLDNIERKINEIQSDRGK